MSLQTIRFSSAAQKDVADAKEWYAAQSTFQLDLRFQQELEHVLKQVSFAPVGFQAVYKDIRKANLRRFPYAVFYHLRNGLPYVLAVVHHARHPNTWKQRAPE